MLRPWEKLLSKRYKYGFRLGSPIELMRIRNYAEEDGISLPDSDEELEREIAATGINIDGKVFIINEEILSEIAALTDAVFDEGATVIFLNQLMEVKEDWLSEQHITTADMLKTLLKRNSPSVLLWAKHYHSWREVDGTRCYCQRNSQNQRGAIGRSDR